MCLACSKVGCLQSECIRKLNAGYAYICNREPGGKVQQND